MPRPAEIAAKYFYDQRGCELFEAITREPEYYPTRCEISLLQASGAGIARSVGPCRSLIELGFEVVATSGTAKMIEAAGLPVRRVNKVTEGRPHVVDMIKNDEVTLIINTTEGRQSIADSYSIRRNALQHRIACTTTLAAGEAICEALKFGPEKTVRRLQDLHAGIKA